MDFGTQMSAHREPCVPSVVFLEENHGLVLVKGPNSGGSSGIWASGSPKGRPASQSYLGYLPFCLGFISILCVGATD